VVYIELRSVRHRMVKRSNVVTNTAETRVGKFDVGWAGWFPDRRRQHLFDDRLPHKTTQTLRVARLPFS